MNSLKRLAERHPGLMRLLKFLLVYAMFWLVAWQRLDPDFGWHLKAGQDIIAHGVPAHDIYTYTAGNFPWVNHEWGYDVLIAAVYGLPGGLALLSGAIAALWTGALYIADKRSSWLVLILATFAMLPYAGIRPTVITIFFFISLLRFTAGRSSRALAAIPLLFVVWANLHAGFIIGLALLLYFAVRDRKLSWVWLFIASTLATLINPYGPKLYIEVARTMFDRTLHTQITEWNSFTITVSSLMFVLLWALGFTLFSGKDTLKWLRARLQWPSKWKSLDDTALGPLLFLASLSATRNIPLFTVATMHDLGNYFKKEKALMPKKLNDASKLILLVAWGFLIFWLYIVTMQSFRSLSWRRDTYFPTQALAYLQAHGCGGGNIYNSYHYGGFLIWKLPSQPVYIDGRMPSWRDDAGEKYMDRYLRIGRDSAYRKSQFKTYNVRCVLIPKVKTHSQLYNDLHAEGWKTAVDADGSLLMTAPGS